MLISNQNQEISLLEEKSLGKLSVFGGGRVDASVGQDAVSGTLLLKVVAVV